MPRKKKLTPEEIVKLPFDKQVDLREDLTPAAKAFIKRFEIIEISLDSKLVHVFKDRNNSMILHRRPGIPIHFPDLEMATDWAENYPNIT